MIEKGIEIQMLQMCSHLVSQKAIRTWSLDARTGSFGYNPEIVGVTR
jgi:hypothetical protein